MVTTEILYFQYRTWDKSIEIRNQLFSINTDLFLKQADFIPDMQIINDVTDGCRRPA